jgi:hypothetical protein
MTPMPKKDLKIKQFDQHFLTPYSNFKLEPVEVITDKKLTISLTRDDIIDPD